MFNVYNRYTDTAGNLHFTDCYEKHGREHIIRAGGGAGMSEVVVRMKSGRCEMAYHAGIKGVLTCPVTKKKCVGQAEIHCPIIAVLPESHGRLVDADERFLGVIHFDGGGFANYNTTIAERIGEEDMRMVNVIVPATEGEGK